MPSFERISTDQANEKITQGDVNIVDIRDAMSFNNGHLVDAELLDNNSIEGFIDNADKALPLIVYCYHGNSSQNAAQFFSERGFAEVYSMDGGFELWKTQYPTSQ